MFSLQSIFSGIRDGKAKFNQNLISSVETAIAQHDHEELSFLLSHKETIDALKYDGAMGVREFERILLSVAGSSHSHWGRKIAEIDMITAELLIKAGANTNRPAYWINGSYGPMEFYIKDTYDSIYEQKDKMRKNPELKSQAEQYKDYCAVETINQKYHTIKGRLARLFQPI